MDFGESPFPFENATSLFPVSDILSVQTLLLFVASLLAVVVVSSLIFIKVNKLHKKFQLNGGYYVLFSICGSICINISFLPFIDVWPLPPPYWALFVFYTGFSVFVSPLICHTWWMICVLIKHMPAFPYFSCSGGECKLEVMTAKELLLDQNFVWKRIPIFIIPPIATLITIPLRTDVDYFTAFIYATNFLDPYDQFMVFLLFFLAIVFVVLYTRKVHQDATTVAVQGRNHKQRSVFVLVQSTLVLTRAIFTILYAIACELILWFILLNRGNPASGMEFLAKPYIVASSVVHGCIGLSSVGILFYRLYENKLSHPHAEATTRTDPFSPDFNL